MKLNLDKSTKDLLVNLAFCVVVAVCCVVAYDRFFVPSVPKIYVIDVAKIETEIRRELIALAYNENNGIPIDKEFVVKEVEKLALIFRKDNLLADGKNVKDITEQVLKMYAKNLKDNK